MSLTPCEVCSVPLGNRETCPSPACPCYGLRAGSPEMEAAAVAWRSRPSVAQRRAISGRDALDVLERRAWLDMAGAAGDVLEVEIMHEAAP